MPTTHQFTGGEETVMKPICISIYGDDMEAMMYRPLGKFGQDAGVTPLLFQKTSWDFL